MDNQKATSAKFKEWNLNYIKQPECLILAVTPAEQDLATSGCSDKSQRTVDPQ
ncbi:hypothetical protein CEXT_536751, partial [Caerostris extrusa]